MTIFRPMLAVDAKLDKLRFPLVASPKLDGVRATVRNGIVFSRSNKPIPNKYVQAYLGDLEFCDGELIVGAANAEDVYRKTVSGVMSEEVDSPFLFRVFDFVRSPGMNYRLRRNDAARAVAKHPYAMLHDQVEILNHDALLAYEKQIVGLGYEGLILRDPNTPYKMGRSTVNEGYLLKLKRFCDSEAVVIGFEERMHNGNEATISELGRTKRSSHKAGKSGRGDLGALVCRTAEGVAFNIGTGFTDDQRAAIWNNQAKYLGKLAKYKFFPVGVKEAPRHPVFLGWRDPIDL